MVDVFNPKEFVREQIEKSKQGENNNISERFANKNNMTTLQKTSKKQGNINSRVDLKKSRSKAYINKLATKKQTINSRKAVKGISRLSSAAFSSPKYQGPTLLQKIQAERERQKRMKQMAENYARMQREAQFNTNQKAVVNNHNAVREQQIRYDNYEQTKLSPGTQAILQRVLRIQTKSNRDNERMQRILRERRIIRDATDIMKTPNMFKQDSRNLDPTGIREDNILMAPNTFKEDPENFILRQKRLNLLQTAEAGNNLKF